MAAVDVDEDSAPEGAGAARAAEADNSPLLVPPRTRRRDETEATGERDGAADDAGIEPAAEASEGVVVFAVAAAEEEEEEETTEDDEGEM